MVHCNNILLLKLPVASLCTPKIPATMYSTSKFTSTVPIGSSSSISVSAPPVAKIKLISCPLQVVLDKNSKSKNRFSPVAIFIAALRRVAANGEAALCKKRSSLLPQEAV